MDGIFRIGRSYQVAAPLLEALHDHSRLGILERFEVQLDLARFRDVPEFPLVKSQLLSPGLVF